MLGRCCARLGPLVRPGAASRRSTSEGSMRSLLLLNDVTPLLLEPRPVLAATSFRIIQNEVAARTARSRAQQRHMPCQSPPRGTGQSLRLSDWPAPLWSSAPPAACKARALATETRDLRQLSYLGGQGRWFRGGCGRQGTGCQGTGRQGTGHRDGDLRQISISVARAVGSGGGAEARALAPETETCHET